MNTTIPNPSPPPSTPLTVASVLATDVAPNDTVPLPAKLVEAATIAVDEIPAEDEVHRDHGDVSKRWRRELSVQAQLQRSWAEWVVTREGMGVGVSDVGCVCCEEGGVEVISAELLRWWWRCGGLQGEMN